MREIRVTITGADEAVDPGELRALSVEFPFVEWGILFSAKRAGTPRYPGGLWLLHLAHQSGLHLSAHLCGQLARDMLSASQEGPPSADWFCENTQLEERFWLFNRIQLNGWTRESGVCRWWNGQYVLQARDETQLLSATAAAFRLHSTGQAASVLYDQSGGTGRAPPSWPAIPADLNYLGYAGGIGPENVEAVLADILSVNTPGDQPFWIDMESGVRDEADRFSLDKVREVLGRVAKIQERA